MKIDFKQPIMFDTPSQPGWGTGFWQMKPPSLRDDASYDSEQPRVVKFLLFTLVFGGIALGGLHMLLF